MSFGGRALDPRLALVVRITETAAPSGAVSVFASHAHGCQKVTKMAEVLDC